MDFDAFGWSAAPPREVEETLGRARLCWPAFKHAQSEVESASDPGVRLEPTPFPATDLPFILAEPGSQLGLGQAEVSADCE